MKQVPYGIIGAGRMARHFSYYLSLLHIPFRHWSRSQPVADLAILIQGSERLLILIQDDAIDAFIKSHEALNGKKLLHFSGRLSTPLAVGVHPLLTFGADLYTLDIYQNMPFIVDNNGMAFSDLLPGLSNPYYPVDSDKKALYHSLCVLSGNFTVLLWQKFFKELAHTIGIPADAGQLYLQQIANNLKNNPQAALTGPLARNDVKTIAANIQALAGDPYQPVYQAFVAAFNGEKNNECC